MRNTYKYLGLYVTGVYSCRGKQTFDQGGLGVNPIGEIEKEDSEFDMYRKRMMLAYKFRPNPLVNCAVN